MSLKIEHLNVAVQGKEILHGISLDIREGEFISLLGQSGCGKTTLLKSIAGLLPVQEGTIRIHGMDVSPVPPEKRGTVIVFQDLRLFPHMTVEKNISFPMELAGIGRAERKQRITELLAAVQLSGFEKRRMREMSGGQMQRVALARALAANPGVLLLDEPFSGLDETLRLEMGTLVRKLHETWKITTILVTHDKREALQMSDRIALMDYGRILQYDAPGEMFAHPRTRTAAEYFGKVNYIEGTVQSGYFVSAVLQCAAAIPDGNYEIMVRPCSVMISPDGDWQITKITFQGELAEVQVRSGQESLICQMMCRELKQRAVKTGSMVQVRINPEDVTWFQKGNDIAYEKDCV